ncbi:HelD family protein [Allorhizocola rhizosphaerae]|uniref:HelD family protein n=1 Tax=Allorhizocola rhizosphaerae TaxID=1872709 RepID=UPI000E3E3695|nr:ATP-binding domain-containing protein [Allorhizocola rhizosphaerae]
MSTDAIAEEQWTISNLYARLDDLREQAKRRLSESLLGPSGGTHQARSERDSTAAMYAQQIRQWEAAEHGLCFGRLDYLNGEHLHIGRIGIFDEENDFEPLLVDWRAPAARLFYLATAASPERVRRRRHIRTRLRKVISVDDEVLDLREAQPQQASSEGLVSEAALMSALNEGRTGRMRDIVETIQAEQDAIIRSDMGGVLVVQGGPGTGKTAVALHRAAYLLYTFREALTRQGVLILGPNETFLRYISQVLPGLGETSVLLSTLGDLFPSVTARRGEPAEVAALKGSLEMARVLRDALAERQRVPETEIHILLSDTHAGFGYERHMITVDPAVIERARDRARRSDQPHNLARPVFVQTVVDALARQVADELGDDPYKDDPLGENDAPGVGLLDEADVAVIRRELMEDSEVDRALDEWWPLLTSEQLLTWLYETTDNELLRRAPGGGWTLADVPLLDEAAELLGESDADAAARKERLRRQRIAYAEGVLDIASGSVSTDIEVDEEAEFLTAGDVLTAAQLAERHIDDEVLTAAQRAAADRRWTFGHVIVDEAQELSPMAWRLLMRRAPNRSMTIVGDVAQTGDLAGASSWGDVLSPYVGDRWRLAELTVNYRTPAEIMAFAAEEALAHIDPSLKPPRSVRETGVQPTVHKGVSDWRKYVNDEDGKVGVILPVSAQTDAFDLDERVSCLTVREAKGLEFDSVVVVDPGRIVAESPRGYNDLYVALTRATQRLTLVYPEI